MAGPLSSRMGFCSNMTTRMSDFFSVRSEKCGVVWRPECLSNDGDVGGTRQENAVWIWLIEWVGDGWIQRMALVHGR